MSNERSFEERIGACQKQTISFWQIMIYTGVDIENANWFNDCIPLREDLRDFPYQHDERNANS
jgi:hypothetical protein